MCCFGMKTILTALLLVTTPCWAWSTVDEYSQDFAKARECSPIEGRKVWAGEQAYYIQSWMFRTGQSGLLDDETASAVPISGNTADALKSFVAACR